MNGMPIAFLSGVGGLNGRVADFLKKAGSALAKPLFAPMRGAFLLIVKLNIKGLADNIWSAYYNSEKGREKIKNIWAGFGGDMDPLLKAVGASERVRHDIKTIHIPTLNFITLFTRFVGSDKGISKEPNKISENLLQYFKEKINLPNIKFVYRTTQPVLNTGYIFDSTGDAVGVDGKQNPNYKPEKNFLIVSEKDRKAYMGTTAYEIPAIFFTPLFTYNSGTSGLGVIDPATQATIALASTIIGTMAAAIKPFLPEDAAKKVSEFTDLIDENKDNTEWNQWLNAGMDAGENYANQSSPNIPVIEGEWANPDNYNRASGGNNTPANNTPAPTTEEPGFFDSITNWIKENPIKSAAIGTTSVAAITLAVSRKARKMVGLGGVRKKKRRISHKRARVAAVALQ